MAARLAVPGFGGSGQPSLLRRLRPAVAHGIVVEARAADDGLPLALSGSFTVVVAFNSLALSCAVNVDPNVCLSWAAVSAGPSCSLASIDDVLCLFFVLCDVILMFLCCSLLCVFIRVD